MVRPKEVATHEATVEDRSSRYKVAYLGATDFEDADNLQVGTDFRWGISDAQHPDAGAFIYSIRVMTHYISHLARIAYEDNMIGRGEETAIAAGNGIIFAKDKAGLKHWYDTLKSATRIEVDLDIKWQFDSDQADLEEGFPERVGVIFSNEISTSSGKEKKDHPYEVYTISEEKFVKDFFLVAPTLVKKDFGAKGMQKFGINATALVQSVSESELKVAFDHINRVLVKRKAAIASISSPTKGSMEDEIDDYESQDGAGERDPTATELASLEKGDLEECKANILLDEDGVPAATKKWIQDFRTKKEKEEAVKMAGLSQSKPIPPAEGVKPTKSANKLGVSDRWDFSVERESRQSLSESYTYMDILMFREGNWTVTINPVGTSGWIVRENIMQNPSFPWRLVGNYLQIATPEDMKDKELDSAIKKLAEALQKGGDITVLED
jgi:hypothetical protein